MNCETCEEQLIDYVHGELSALASAEVAGHLAECSTCALSFCRLRADVQGIVSTYAKPPRAEVAAALRERVAAHVERSWWSRLRSAVIAPVPAYGIALAAAVPLLVWGAASMRADPTASAPAAIELKPAVIRDYDASEPFRDPRIL